MLNINPYAQGAVYYAHINIGEGTNVSLYKKPRPVVIISSINIADNSVIVAPATSQQAVNGVDIDIDDDVHSKINVEKTFPIHVCHLKRFIGFVEKSKMDEIFHVMDILYGRITATEEEIKKYFPNQSEYSIKLTNNKPYYQHKDVTEPTTISEHTINSIKQILKVVKPDTLDDFIHTRKYSLILACMNKFERDHHEIITNGVMNGLSIDDIYDVINHNDNPEPKESKPETHEPENLQLNLIEDNNNTEPEVIKREPKVYDLPSEEEKNEQPAYHKRSYVRLDLKGMSDNDLIWIYCSDPKDICDKYGVSITTALRHKNNSIEILRSRGIR